MNETKATVAYKEAHAKETEIAVLEKRIARYVDPWCMEAAATADRLDKLRRELRQIEARSFEIDTRTKNEKCGQKIIWSVWEQDGSDDGRHVADVYTSQDDAIAIAKALGVVAFINGEPQ